MSWLFTWWGILVCYVVGGLTATAQVAFHSPHGKPLKGRLQIRFRAHKSNGKGRR